MLPGLLGPRAVGGQRSMRLLDWIVASVWLLPVLLLSAIGLWNRKRVCGAASRPRGRLSNLGLVIAGFGTYKDAQRKFARHKKRKLLASSARDQEGCRWDQEGWLSRSELRQVLLAAPQYAFASLDGVVEAVFREFKADAQGHINSLEILQVLVEHDQKQSRVANCLRHSTGRADLPARAMLRLEYGQVAVQTCVLVWRGTAAWSTPSQIVLCVMILWMAHVPMLLRKLVHVHAPAMKLSCAASMLCCAGACMLAALATVGMEGGLVAEAWPLYASAWFSQMHMLATWGMLLALKPGHTANHSSIVSEASTTASPPGAAAEESAFTYTTLAASHRASASSAGASFASAAAAADEVVQIHIGAGEKPPSERNLPEKPAPGLRTRLRLLVGKSMLPALAWAVTLSVAIRELEGGSVCRFPVTCQNPRYISNLTRAVLLVLLLSSFLFDLQIICVQVRQRPLLPPGLPLPGHGGGPAGTAAPSCARPPAMGGSEAAGSQPEPALSHASLVL